MSKLSKIINNFLYMITYSFILPLYVNICSVYVLVRTISCKIYPLYFLIMGLCKNQIFLYHPHTTAFGATLSSSWWSTLNITGNCFKKMHREWDLVYPSEPFRTMV